MSAIICFLIVIEVGKLQRDFSRKWLLKNEQRLEAECFFPIHRSQHEVHQLHGHLFGYVDGNRDACQRQKSWLHEIFD